MFSWSNILSLVTLELDGIPWFGWANSDLNKTLAHTWVKGNELKGVG